MMNLYIDHHKRWLDKLAETGKKMRDSSGETRERDSDMLGIMAYREGALCAAMVPVARPPAITVRAIPASRCRMPLLVPQASVVAADAPRAAE